MRGRFKSGNRCRANKNAFHSPKVQVTKARRPGVASSPGQIAQNVHNY